MRLHRKLFIGKVIHHHDFTVKVSSFSERRKQKLKNSSSKLVPENRRKIHKTSESRRHVELHTQAKVHVRTMTCPQERESLSSQSPLLSRLGSSGEKWQNANPQGGWLNLKPKSRKVAVQSLLCDVLSKYIRRVQGA